MEAHAQLQRQLQLQQETLFEDIVLKSSEPTPNVQTKRGGCLTAFLISMLIANPLFGLYNYVAGPSVAQSLPTMPAWIFPLLGLIGIANFIFAIAIWKWKKWGAYGFLGSFVLAMLLYLMSGADILPTVATPLIGISIFLLLVGPIWKQMD